MSTTAAEPRATPAYQLFMLALSVLALLGIAVQNVLTLDPEIEILLDYADLLICIAFAIDFMVSMWRAPNRGRYFLTWGWIDLLSSIPTLDVARWGRLARLARILRILRAIRAARLMTTAVLQTRKQSTLLAATLLALILVIAGSTAVLVFEKAENSNIVTAEDALWWSFTTITTVGYGDRFPVTTGGRTVAVLLMCAGVGLFGALSASLAAWFLAPAEETTENEVAQLREEIASLRAAVERLGDRG